MGGLRWRENVKFVHTVVLQTSRKDVIFQVIFVINAK